MKKNDIKDNYIKDGNVYFKNIEENYYYNKKGLILLKENFSLDHIYNFFKEKLYLYKYKKNKDINNNIPLYKLLNLLRLKFASVNIPIILISGLKKIYILFTLRSKDLKNHAGEFSFPGGRFDFLKDRSFKNTAIRETVEEIGISFNKIFYFSSIISKTKYYIKSFVSVIEHKNFDFLNKIKVNRLEIQKIYIIDLMIFLLKPAFFTVEWNYNNRVYRLGCFDLQTLKEPDIINNSNGNSFIFSLKNLKTVNIAEIENIIYKKRKLKKVRFLKEGESYKIPVDNIIWGISAKFLEDLLKYLLNKN